MTQEQLADATGLTSVHVNRVLKMLSEEGLIRRTKRIVTIPDWEGLRSVAGFNETYLISIMSPGACAKIAALDDWVGNPDKKTPRWRAEPFRSLQEKFLCLAGRGPQASETRT